MILRFLAVERSCVDIVSPWWSTQRHLHLVVSAQKPLISSAAMMDAQKTTGVVLRQRYLHLSPVSYVQFCWLYRCVWCPPWMCEPPDQSIDCHCLGVAQHITPNWWHDVQESDQPFVTISPWHPNFGRFDMVKFQFWLILYQHLAGVVCFGWFLHPMVVACCCLNHNFIWWSPRYIHDHDPHIFPDQTGIYPGIKDLIGGVLRGLSQDPKRGLGGFLIREVLGVSLTCPTMFLLSHCCKWACFQNGVYYSTPHFASRTRQSRLSQWFAMPET